jgi:hypothetical protein
MEHTPHSEPLRAATPQEIVISTLGAMPGATDTSASRLALYRDVLTFTSLDWSMAAEAADVLAETCRTLATMLSACECARCEESRYEAAREAAWTSYLDEPEWRAYRDEETATLAESEGNVPPCPACATSGSRCTH